MTADFIRKNVRRAQSFALRTGDRLLRRVEPVGGAVFFYHHVTGTPCPYTDRLDICRTPEVFAEQIAYLTRNFEVVPFSVLLRNPHRKNMVAVTFDDGYHSVLDQALPVLEKYRCPAKIFLNAAQTRGEPGWLNKLSAVLGHHGGLPPAALMSACIPDWGLDEVPSVFHYWNQFAPERTIPAVDRAFAACTGLPDHRGLFLSRREITGLLPHPLLEWGSHSARHYPLDRLGSSDLSAEVEGGHTELKSWMGERLQGFAVPFGTAKFRTRRIAAAVRAVDRYFVSATGDRLRRRYIGGLREIQRIEAPTDLATMRDLLEGVGG
jgi:peptidoglycan/xylan/chitin deacetylase (PgdA/CDA1 family)